MALAAGEDPLVKVKNGLAELHAEVCRRVARGGTFVAKLPALHHEPWPRLLAPDQGLRHSTHRIGVAQNRRAVPRHEDVDRSKVVCASGAVVRVHRAAGRAAS